MLVQLRSTDLVSKKKNDPSSEFRWPAGAILCNHIGTVCLTNNGRAFLPNLSPAIDTTFFYIDLTSVRLSRRYPWQAVTAKGLKDFNAKNLRSLVKVSSKLLDARIFLCKSHLPGLSSSKIGDPWL